MNFNKNFDKLDTEKVIYGENYCDTGLHAPENSTDPTECCPSPLFLPIDIVKECRDTYMEMQKKKNDLPGLPRGCVNFEFLCHFFIFRKNNKFKF